MVRWPLGGAPDAGHPDGTRQKARPKAAPLTYKFHFVEVCLRRGPVELTEAFQITLDHFERYTTPLADVDALLARP